MAKFEVKNAEGQQVAEAELPDAVDASEPNIHVMHHLVKCQQACWRQGTQSTKGRSEVSGGGKKPRRQKGTGRARQGSIRTVPKTFIITPAEANTYDIVNNGALLMPADVAAHFGEVLA